MQTQLHKDTIRVSIFILVYMISLNTPYALAQIGIVKGLFIGIRIVCTGLMFLFCLIRRMKWNRFDIATVLFCTCFLVSAIHAGVPAKTVAASVEVYLYNAVSRIVFVTGQLLLIKMISDMQKEVSKIALKVVFWYYTVLCIINLFTQILGMTIPEKGENFFFLGLDNEVGKYYLYAVFYCCVTLIMEEKRISREFLLVVVITIAEALYRRIGGLTVLSILLVGLVLLMYFAPKARIWRIRQETLIEGMIIIYVVVMISFTKLDILQKLVNMFLYGKAGALQIRFALQLEFLSRWRNSPWFGWASIMGGVGYGDATWFDYALARGHAHNFFIDALYNYGIFSLLLYLYLIFLAVRRIEGKKEMVSFLGMIFILIVSRGMFENGCQNIFAVLPMLYYLDDMLGGKQVDPDKELAGNVQKF